MMLQPDVRDVHIDAVLTNMSVMFLQPNTNFVAWRAFPAIGVDKKTDKYFVFDRNAFYRDEMKRRAPGTESAGGGYTVSTDEYSCDDWALHKDIPDQVRLNADNPLNPDRNAVQYLTQQAMIRAERQWATDYFTTSVWTTDVTPGDLWDDHELSDPVGDIRTGKRTVLARTGIEPNRLIVGYDVWLALVDHPDILDRYKHTSADNITPELIARLLELDEVMVCKAVYATNVEGETGAYSFIHGKHALLLYSPPNPGIEIPSAGYTYIWRGISEGIGANAAVSRFRMPQLRSDRVEIEMAWDNKKTSADLGYFFASVVS